MLHTISSTAEALSSLHLCHSNCLHNCSVAAILLSIYSEAAAAHESYHPNSSPVFHQRIVLCCKKHFSFFFPPLFYTLLLYFCLSVEIAANFDCRSKLEQNHRSSSIYNIVFKDHRNYCLMIFFLILHLHSKTKNYYLMIIFKLILHLHSNTQKKFNDFFHVDSASAFRNSLKYFHCGWGGEWVQPLEQGLNKSFRDGLPVLVYNEAFATSRDDTQ